MDATGEASVHVRYWHPVDITCDVVTANQSFSLRRYREDESGNVKTKTTSGGIGKWLQQEANDPDKTLPLLCYQSAARVWQVRREDYAKVLKENLNDRRAGYVGCMDFSMDIKGIQAWCEKMDRIAYQKHQQIGEYEAFLNTVAIFMQHMNRLEKAPKVFYSAQFAEFMYGEADEAMPISKLSAGYQSLLWMVMNLSYRMAALNPELGARLREAEGIVLVDEVDMHLHPKWQWNIVKALEETFPNVQFILATHSPIVISSCKNERLILIDEEQQVCYLPNAYGYSVQDVLTYRQGTVEKPEKIKKLFTAFDNALEDEATEKAEAVLHQLAALLGENHADVARARTDLALSQWSED